jgi:hypothetical protein
MHFKSGFPNKLWQLTTTVDVAVDVAVEVAVVGSVVVVVVVTY